MQVWKKWKTMAAIMLALCFLGGHWTESATAETIEMSGQPPAGLIGLYTFEDVTGGTVPDDAPAAPDAELTARPDGAGFGDADLFGSSPMGNRLGSSGRVFEPTAGSNDFAFWLDKSAIASSPDWSVLMWVNRADLDNLDFLFYVGTSDGFSGWSAETYVLGDSSGRLVAENYRTEALDSRDMYIEAGQMTARQWHQVGMVREGTSFSLFLDGDLLGTDAETDINSLDVVDNSVIVFGGLKQIYNESRRSRMLDGLLDQIEIYNVALSESEIRDRYEVMAVPEPSTFFLLCAGTLAMLACARRRSRL